MKRIGSERVAACNGLFSKAKQPRRWQNIGRLALLLVLLVHSNLLPSWAQGKQEGTGPDQKYFPVHDFQQEFVIYDEAFKAYVPFIPELHSTQTGLSASIDIESNRHYKLLIQSRKDGFLFINAALRQKCPAATWLVLDVDSLYRLYRKPTLFLTLYGPPAPGNWQLLLGYPRTASQKTIRLNDDGLSVRPRGRSEFDSFFSIGLLFLLASHAFLYTFFRRAFLLFYNPLNLARLISPDEAFLVNRPLSRISLTFSLNLSFLMAFLVLCIIHHQIPFFELDRFLPQQQTFGNLLGSYALISLLIFLVFIGKYLLIAAVGSLYKFDELVNTHYFKILQASLLFATTLVLTVAALTTYLPTLETPINFFLVLTAGFYVVRAGWLYLTFTRLSPVKNLYLFSYLCIVELIPLIIGIRFAVQ